MKIYDIVKTKQVYSGKIISVNNDTVVMPNGNHAIREVVLHGGATAIVPIDSNGKIIFVRQYRHPALQEVLEIPAGMIENNENPIDCAKRELEEEIGFIGKNISFMFKSYTAIGFSNEIIHYYLAENLLESKQNLDEDEFINIERYTLNEALEFIKNGKIIDNKTIAGILFYKEFFDCKKL